MTIAGFLGPTELILGLFPLILFIIAFIVFFLMASNVAKINKMLGEIDSSLKDIKESLKK